MRAPRFKTQFSFWLPILVSVSGLVSMMVVPLYLRGQQDALQVGYAVVTPDPGTKRPVGTALFSVTNSQNVLVSQAGVEAVEPIRKGRFFVDEVGSRTGVALVNPGPLSAAAVLILRDSTGRELMRKSQTVGSGRHLAAFVDEIFPPRQVGLRGSVTFESDQPLGAIALRESQNRYGEPLYATLPIVDLDAVPNSDAIVFPHLAVGQGYQTQLLLINRGTQNLHGRVRFWGSDGQPLVVGSLGNTASEIAYQIEPEGAYRAELDSPSGLKVGYAVVTPDPGSSSPAGTAIFQFREQGQLVTEASVAATRPTKRSRIFVDHAISRTGLAVANTGSLPAELTIVLMDRFGSVETTTTRTVPANGHLAQFAHEVFPGYLTEGFNGLVEIQSSTPVSPITLKLTTNSRSETVLTTLPVADLDNPTGAVSVLFPHLAIGSGFATRLIFIAPDSGSTQTGGLSFFRSDGSAMVLPMRGQVASQFPYQFTVGSGSQLYPGNTAQVATIQVVDSASDLPSTEIAINVGGTVRPRMRVIDNSGELRGDFDVSVQSLDTAVASVDSNGSLHGEREGFATLTLSSGTVVTSATATVVRINSGAPGFVIKGVAQDQASRLYLAAATESAVLLAQSVSQTPGIYAGIVRSPGLKNGLRLESQFQSPSFLALNHQNGDLYVSDGANHLIRRVGPGTSGVVESFAGTGIPGSGDGHLTEASFNNPQGIALDGRGNLWVADSGNHTIRRINLVSRTVETIAGMPGNPGFADGRGQEARFRGLVGLAIAFETAEHEAERQRRNEPPPPVQVLIADSGNNVIRRVTEAGHVETLGSTNVSASRADGSKPSFAAAAPPPVAPLLFNAPTGLAFDPLGNIFVTETSTGQVKTILNTGAVVSATQRNTYTSPGGIAITRTGSVVVADGNRAAQEILYGEPVISSLLPDNVSIRGGEIVTIKGRNFAPDSLVILGGVQIGNMQIQDTGTITLTTPTLPSGLVTLTVQNRGGLAQTSMTVKPPSLSELLPGQITTIAGGSTFTGDGSLATFAKLAYPGGVAVDVAGNLYIADVFNSRIRKVDRSGIITTVAGNGEAGFSGDAGPATAASLNYPEGIAVDTAGNLFIADTRNRRIRKVEAANRIITTVAGTDQSGFSGDGGPATAASMSGPTGVAVDTISNLFITDGSQRVRKVTVATGIITTVAGNGQSGFSGDGGPATAASLSLYALGARSGIVVDASGDLFIADLNNNRVRKVAADTAIITTVVGTGEGRFSGDGGPATAATVRSPSGIAVDTTGSLFIADYGNQRVRKVEITTGVITTVAGNGQSALSADGVPATGVSLPSPAGLAIDGAGNLFMSDGNAFTGGFNGASNRIRRIAPTGIITTVAGIGQLGFSTGDGGLATLATLSLRALAIPGSPITLDAAGNLFINEPDRIRKVSAESGTITTVAGNGRYGFSGDGVPAIASSLSQPAGVAVDSTGNLFIADMSNARVRKVDAATGIITTVAGNGQLGFSGDGGPATAARVNPSGIAFDSLGNLFIADKDGYRVRKMAAGTGIITTVAGNGQQGVSGNGGAATTASLTFNGFPAGIAVDGTGNLFISDFTRIRRVAAATGIISAVAGSGQQGFSGDGGPATTASLRLGLASLIAVDEAGNLFIADSLNNRVRKVTATTGIITTVAGDGRTGSSGDYGPATSASLTPAGIAVDRAGNLLIADTWGHRIRAVRGVAVPRP